jgi:hypothetical protein
LVTTDDFVYAIEDRADREKMHCYMLSKGITYRDDSILVNYYIGAYPDTFTVRSAEYFADVWLNRPTVLELEHYRIVRQLGNWAAQPGSSLAKHGQGKTGADFLRGAMELLHATYIGYHGDALRWLAENPDLTVELLNRCGYWFFVHSATVPQTMQAGQSHTIQLAWENRGVAPAYHPYTLMVRLVGPETARFEFDAANRRWLPEPAGTVYHEDYRLEVPASLAPGRYTLKIKLHAKDARRNVSLALDGNLLDDEKFYTIGATNISASKR